MKSTFRRHLLASTLLITGSALASPALAQSIATPEAGTIDQSQAPGDGEIVVTGSRIQRTDLQSTSPVAVVAAEEFALSGAINVEQVINTLPQVLPGLTGFSNNPGNGAVTLNLRNLGTTRTLVLVNGRRWMFFDTTQVVDTNTIPQFLLEGVEVVTGGASAVYGTDAVAGVVNFKLRNNLRGIEMGANYSLTERGDGARYSFDVAIGSSFDDNRGNVTLFANYTERKPIFQSARSFSASAAGEGCIVPGSTNGETSIGQPFPSGIAVGTCLARGGQLGFVPQGSATGPIGTFVAPNAGGVATTYIFNPSGGGSRVFQDPGDLYNFAPANYLQLPQERYLFGGYGSYEITPGVEFYTELSYVNNTVPQELAATPTGLANVPLFINSPFFNAQTRALLTAQDAAEAAATRNDGYALSTVSYRFLSAGPRNADQERSAFRILGGVRGTIVDNLNYDLFYSYSRTNNTQRQTGNISSSRYRNALNVEFVPGSTTQLQCRDAAARTAGCVPINVFGSGLADPAAVRYVSVNSTNLQESSLKNIVGSISGSLFNLGMGADDVGFAFGGEYRDVFARYTPDTFLASGDVLGFNAGQPTQGGYDVKEVFGELRVPVVRDGFIYQLELNGAARYSDYSLQAVGGNWTYTAGADFAPIRDIRFRGQYARAVRAPNVENLFGGRATGFPAANDPCSDRGPAATQTAALRALCVANGVPANLVFTRAVQPNTQIQSDSGGNPNVQEEVSDTYTVGAVIQPTFIPRLNVTVDYFNIEVRDTIGTIALGTALDLCYNVTQDLNSVYCSYFQGARSSQGALGVGQGGQNPLLGASNLGTTKTSGIDMQVDYNVDLFGGRLAFSYLGTWLDKFRSRAIDAIPVQTTIAEGTFGLPKYRHTTRLTYAAGPAQLSFRWRFNGKTQDTRIDNTYGLVNGVQTRIGTNPAAISRPFLQAYNYFDLTATFDASDQLTFNIGVNNLLDAKPPVLGGSEQANTFPSFFDVLGRDFFVSARLRF
ncbi:TonB-dependent Receptor Plug Domain [Sphingomonas guangdongensis]|uniref:TonB-dependent Receptor Plug Domain n=1 Tax=Sphingomonas guangdongensis TaxID=1141890 RepID=A0A285QZ40_9SPHN|nr:TonB-dependent receptor [Sphingomonas guangdongensis]SOB86854.1 TonB-dependent Receptor Plug Domain [Sphingomonas guangdongensis]